MRYLIPLRKETREKTDDKDIHYYDRDRIAACVTMIITTIVLALLMVPIWLLYRFSIAGTIATSPDTVCVVLVFTLVFSAALSTFTKARRHEIVAASAGSVRNPCLLTAKHAATKAPLHLAGNLLTFFFCRYCAVLVVFLGNVNSRIGSVGR